MLKIELWDFAQLTQAAVEPVFKDDNVEVAGVGPSHLDRCVVGFGP